MLNNVTAHCQITNEIIELQQEIFLIHKYYLVLHVF